MRRAHRFVPTIDIGALGRKHGDIARVAQRRRRTKDLRRGGRFRMRAGNRFEQRRQQHVVRPLHHLPQALEVGATRGVEIGLRFVGAPSEPQRAGAAVMEFEACGDLRRVVGVA